MSRPRRAVWALGVALAAIGGIGGTATVATAHSEFTPATVPGGATVKLNLFVEDEKDDAGTTRVDLRFPDGVALTVVDLPAASGFTAAVRDGAVGGTGTGVVWEGGPATGDVNLSLTLGPFPTSGGRLQFKVLQTYDNGDVDRWIADWPAGAAEPDNPGPVIDVTAAASTTAPTPSTTATESGTETTAGLTETTAAAPRGDGGEGGSSLPLLVGIGGGTAAIAALAAVLVARRRR